MIENLDTRQYMKKISDECIACKRCMKDCLFLQSYCESPKELFSEMLSENSNFDLQIPYSCMMCGRCMTVCPLDLDLAGVFLSIRQDLVNQSAGKLPLKSLKSVDYHQRFSFSQLFSSKYLKNKGGK